MSEQSTARHPVTQIGVRLQVGGSLLSASDDTLFLGLRGPAGREFRLALAHGSFLRRAREDVFLLGAAGHRDTNVAHPQLNDPTKPEIESSSIQSLYLRKGFDPIPNVRALGELDDRLEIVEVAIDVHAEGRSEPLRFRRSGPLWLGLVCGLSVEVPRSEAVS
jgi:hypothetical protein